MISNVARFLMASAAVSLVAFGSAPADACSDISDGALDIISGALPTPPGVTIGVGAQFFTWTQRLVYGVSGTDILNRWTSTSPSSLIYYNQFIVGTYAAPVTNATSIAAGDVLVIGRGTTGSYGGHTVIITDVAQELINMTANPPLAPEYTNTRQWALEIADSTSTSHGCNPAYPDSRWAGNCAGGTFTPGLGTAFMRIYSDLSGNLSGLSGTEIVTTGTPKTLTGQGHTWSVTSGSPVYDPTTRPYVIGRVTPCPLFP